MNADTVLAIAYPIAKDTGSTIDHIIWEMPIPRLFKLIGVIQRFNSTEHKTQSRVRRRVNKSVLVELSQRGKKDE